MPADADAGHISAGAIGFGNGNISGSPSGSNFGMNGMGSPGSASHHGSSPTMPTSGSAASITGTSLHEPRWTAQASFSESHLQTKARQKDWYHGLQRAFMHWSGHKQTDGGCRL